MTEIKTLALKYRPQNFDELIGQEDMVLTIQNSLMLDKVPNAYLLTGIRGTGKTTTARLIAKAINCNKDFLKKEKCTDKEFCHCEAIINSNHIDILEMDAASRTGVDDVREILESSKYHPSSAKYKVFIIDEVHMLSKQAFNALLKTLEEPPPHLKFILATTEVKKIPVTILSRCQRFDLRRIKVDEMAQYLKKVSDQEKGKIDDGSISLIAKASEGSVRDALSLLDQALITFNLQGETVTEEKIRKMLGLADTAKIISLMSSIIEGDLKKSLNEFNQIYDIGADPKLVLHSLLEVAYLITRTKSLGKIENDLSVSEEQSKTLESLSQKVDMTYLSMLWHYLLKATEDLSIYPNLQIAFEMILMRLCNLKLMPNPQDVLERAEANTNQVTNPISKSNYENHPSKLQIKNISQEVKNPDPKIETNPQFVIKNFEELVKMANDKREIDLKFDLERNVRLVKFQEGKIDIAFNEKLSKNFIKSLTEKLLQWTGKRWLISFTKGYAGETLYEKNNQIKQKLLEDAKQTEEYKSVMKMFPDAELVDVTKIEENE